MRKEGRGSEGEERDADEKEKGGKFNSRRNEG